MLSPMLLTLARAAIQAEISGDSLTFFHVRNAN
jgi:hypothetical protein